MENQVNLPDQLALFVMSPPPLALDQIHEWLLFIFVLAMKRKLRTGMIKKECAQLSSQVFLLFLLSDTFCISCRGAH